MPSKGAGPRPHGHAPSRAADRVERQAPAPSPRQAKQPGDEAPTHGGDIVYGRHPVLAALQGERAVNKVWVLRDLQNQALVAEVRQLAKEKGASVQVVERPKLDALTLDANHQGLVVSLAAASYVALEDLMEQAMAAAHPALLMLDGIEDPQNLGALIRTAEGAGFQGVIIPNRRAVGLTPVVAKVSAGAVDRVPVARTGNLSQAAEALKARGFWLVGADAEGEALPWELDLRRPLVLVLGAEGKGLSRLLATRCDHRVRLPLAGELESLNASAAGAVLMYEAVRQRPAGTP
ncbi:MAG: 23S rRNA (guanosine(2251)-2'-O)-methyltransferase RlmB [Candidatus Sericytochromatia bacterium]|nr:23S rRNA (guanosine(2251)-2'-O)-methyltransferase RlmB [Candidatus Sericytochromatia bacterium]